MLKKLLQVILWKPTRPSRTNTKKRGLLHHRGLECKSRKSTNSWNKMQKFRLGEQNEAGQRLTKFCQENILVTANTLFQQHKRQLWNQIDYVLCSPKWRSSKQSAKTRPETYYGLDHELFIATFKLKLKKVGKTTRPFKYDLNQIHYDYTVEVTDRLKGFDLIECLKSYGWRCVTLYRRQWSRPSPWKRNENGKMVVWRGLSNNWEKKRREGQMIWMQSSKE